MSPRRIMSLLFAVGALGGAARSADAQQLDPEDVPADPALAEPWVEWALGFRTVTSVNGARHEGQGTRSAIDFSDSLLYVRPRVPLTAFRDLRAGALFSVTFPDVYNQPGTLFLGDAQTFLENRWAFLRIGRGRLTSHIVPVPSLRDDDLIRFAEAQNPFSNGESTADHQFGNVADLTLWPTPRLYADLHAENLSNSVLASGSLTAFELNSAGITLGYRQIPALTTLTIVRQFGVGGNAYHVNLPEQKWTFDLLGGGWFNLVADPVRTVDWRIQAIYAPGVTGTDPSTSTGSFRARSVSAFSSLGYSYRRSLLPMLRATVAGGYRRYPDQSVDQMSVLGNVYWSVGQTVEIGAQYQYRRADAGLPRIFGEDQVQSLKIFLVGTFETVVNPLFDDRASLLNTESGYLP